MPTPSRNRPEHDSPGAQARDADAAVSPRDQAGALRIIDANANRALEGLRVAEDYLRFIVEDRLLSAEAKQIRHDLTQALLAIPVADRHRCRSTTTDVGTTAKAADEYQRDSLPTVALANLRRVAEALRAIEETCKVDCVKAGQVGVLVESLRYRLYTLEKAVTTRSASARRLDGRQLYVLTDADGPPEEFARRIQNVLDGGADVLQLRDKRADDRRLLAYARHLRQLTRGTDCLVVINDRPDLAILAQADGVHVGQDELTVADVRSLVGPRMLIGVSTHSWAQAQQAILDGADYLGIGPMFSSQTKSFRDFPGIDFARQVAANVSLPCFAIGGISRHNVDQLLEVGVCRIAVSAAIWQAENCRQAACDLKQRLLAPRRT